MQQSRLAHDLFAEISREISRCLQINRATEDARELKLQAGERDAANRSAWEKLDEHIYITLGREVLPQDAAKETQPRDPMAPTEVSDLGEMRING